MTFDSHINTKYIIVNITYKNEISPVYTINISVTNGGL